MKKLDKIYLQNLDKNNNSDIEYIRSDLLKKEKLDLLKRLIREIPEKLFVNSSYGRGRRDARIDIRKVIQKEIKECE